jgi:AcrR family transcriptional regulator
MRASKAKTEIRQGQISQAALRLLAMRGWRRVSLAAIAKEVGIVASDVYRHFNSTAKIRCWTPCWI